MKNNKFFLIISAIAIALVVGLAFVFVDQNKNLVHYNEVFIPYLSGKIIYGCALIFVTLWVYFTEKARGHALALLLATYAVQFVPLLLRLGFEMRDSGKTFVMLYEILLLALPLIAYLIAVSLIYYQDKKMVASDHKYEGGTIEVVSEKEAEERNYRNIKKESEDTIPVVSEEESELNNLK